MFPSECEEKKLNYKQYKITEVKRLQSRRTEKEYNGHSKKKNTGSKKRKKRKEKQQIIEMGMNGSCVLLDQVNPTHMFVG